MNQEVNPTMRNEALTIGLLSDFNAQNLAALLQKNEQQTQVNCVLGPFGQTTSILLDAKVDFWSKPYDALVLWTLPDRAIPAFQKALSFQGYDPAELLDEVNAFADLVRGIPGSVRTILIPTWVAPGIERGWGPLDLTSGVGVAYALQRMNLALADRLGKDRRVVLLNSEPWMVAGGATAYNPRLWYLSKTPFHHAVFQESSRDFLAALDGVRGRSKKLVILDLDNTLWGGVVGDVGWEKLKLGGHDAIGEAFVDFQKGLRRLLNRGVVLGIASKNEESVALEAIRQHPEMVLRLQHFVGWRINWQDKAQNIADLVSELNLGLESAIFLDDSPFERARVREALPQVMVPDMPEDPAQYPLFLSRLRCFDSPVVSDEDRNRTEMYVADRGRTALRQELPSLEQWLEMLNLNICVERLSDKNLDRAAQLFNKTNQINLSTRRLPASELLHWAQAEGHALWTFRVCDKFGDYGLCGVTSLSHDSAGGRIVDFLLSCRVAGRGVEEAMLATATQYARESGWHALALEYVPSAKNEPCRKWLQGLPFLRRDGNRFEVPLQDPLPLPRHVRISFS
jgi:FkbH-like protein